VTSLSINVKLHPRSAKIEIEVEREIPNILCFSFHFLTVEFFLSSCYFRSSHLQVTQPFSFAVDAFPLKLMSPLFSWPLPWPITFLSCCCTLKRETCALVTKMLPVRFCSLWLHDYKEAAPRTMTMATMASIATSTCAYKLQNSPMCNKPQNQVTWPTGELAILLQLLLAAHTGTTQAVGATRCISVSICCQCLTSSSC